MALRAAAGFRTQGSTSFATRCPLARRVEEGAPYPERIDADVSEEPVGHRLFDLDHPEQEASGVDRRSLTSVGFGACVLEGLLDAGRHPRCPDEQGRAPATGTVPETWSRHLRYRRPPSCLRPVVHVDDAVVVRLADPERELDGRHPIGEQP